MVNRFVSVLTATFDIANRKAEKATYTSDLSTTETPTDAGSDVERLEKRVSKSRVTYSPAPSSPKRAKLTRPKTSPIVAQHHSSLANLPEVRIGLLERSNYTEQGPAGAGPVDPAVASTTSTQPSSDVDCTRTPVSVSVTANPVLHSRPSDHSSIPTRHRAADSK